MSQHKMKRDQESINKRHAAVRAMIEAHRGAESALAVGDFLEQLGPQVNRNALYRILNRMKDEQLVATVGVGPGTRYFYTGVEAQISAKKTKGGNPHGNPKAETQERHNLIRVFMEARPGESNAIGMHELRTQFFPNYEQKQLYHTIKILKERGLIGSVGSGSGLAYFYKPNATVTLSSVRNAKPAMGNGALSITLPHNVAVSLLHQLFAQVIPGDES